MRGGEAASGPWTASPLLERADQMDALEGSMATVRDAREGRLVLIRGEAGAGKTAVVRAFCEQPGGPIRVLWGACEALFTPRALAPFVDIAEVTGGEFGTLVQGAAQPHEVLGALTREVATRRPTALVLEDIHWADEATLDVLRLLGRRIAAFEGLVIATYREDEVDGSRELRMVLGELARASGVESLRVPRLSPRAVAELAEPTKVNPVELYRRTGGNAFFVTEVLAAGTHEIPSTVRDAVLARAAGLGGIRVPAGGRGNRATGRPECDRSDCC